MKWFLHSEDKIQGPYDTEMILELLESSKINFNAHVWTKGHVEWLPLAQWHENIDSFRTEEVKKQKGQLWNLKIGKSSKADLTIDQIIEQLKSLKNLQNIYISNEENSDWIPVYSSFILMEALNLSRRNHFRAPLFGLAKVTRKGSRFSYVVKTSTVGQGGMGAYGLGPNFSNGTLVSLKIESEDLKKPIQLDGEVVYNTNKGYIGFKFDKLSTENRNTISEYTSQFQESKGTKDKAS